MPRPPCVVCLRSTSRRHLRAIRRRFGVLPALRYDLIGNLLHCPQLLLDLLDRLRVALEYGRTVVHAVGIGCQRWHQTIYLCRRDGDGHTFIEVASLPHQAGTDIAMQVAIQRLIQISRGIFEGSHNPNHGQQRRERVLRPRWEGYMQDGCGVDDLVDGFAVICTWNVSLVLTRASDTSYLDYST